MRKAIGNWFFAIMVCLCAFVFGFFAGQNTSVPAQITVLNAADPAPAVDAAQEEVARPTLQEEDAAPEEQAPQEQSKPLRININTADAETLDLLPGIGESYAQRIIDYRNSNGSFQTIEEIMEVSGIGEKTFAKLKDMITVGG